jgi:hypothetical protein
MMTTFYGHVFLILALFQVHKVVTTRKVKNVFATAIFLVPLIIPGIIVTHCPPVRETRATLVESIPVYRERVVVMINAQKTQ